jgi:diphosphomevalonate decarboxylase
LFEGRAQRAQQRFQQLVNDFEKQDWSAAYSLVWQEFYDMHALFETAQPHFGYIQPQSVEVLAYLRNYWLQHQDGPLVTMDAGPNIHLLFRIDQQHQFEKITTELRKKFQVM